jgi:hypothetical protein
MKDNVMVFDISEISKSKWDDKKVEIPVFQRSLVWKPKQVELLWDSILRGFPIGSFTLSESDTSNNSDDSIIYLMDGQQRFNAIRLGFEESVWTDNVDQKKELTTALWLDIDNNTNNSSRRYWIKATTKYHPWGYNNNDDCSTLSANEKRDAMKAFGLEGRSIYMDPISLSETWPHKAKFPIPLHLFLNANFNSEDEFIDSIIVAINKYAPKESWKKIYWNKDTDLQDAKSLIKKHKYYEVFKNVQNYSVSGTLLSDEIIQKESIENNEASTDLEILFNRLGTGGTQITQAELIYSAITAYWGEIKDKNEKLSKEYMPPSDLVMLAFRLLLTDSEDKDKLSGTPTIPQIRNLRKNKDFANELEKLYNNELSDVLKRVDNMISGDDYDKTPTILKLDIYKNHPDIVLLLMYIAHKKHEVDNVFSRAFVFYILWFASNENVVVQTVYKYIKNNALSIRDSIYKALFECVYKECIKSIPTLNNLIHNVESSGQHVRVYNLIKQNNNLLLFAQRKFLYKTFPKYKPVSSSDWEEHNRPWDYDHIIPQAWISGKQSKYREKCKEYLWTIGNLAAIPFESNREKNANQNWEYYKENKDDLYFDQALIDLIEGIDQNLTHKEALANNFVRFCKERMNKIFNDLHNTLFSHINFDLKLSENEFLLPDLPRKRKDFFQKLMEDNRLKNFKLYYVDEDSELEIEVDETKVIDWSRTWLSLGFVNENDGFMISITSMNGTDYEIGLRILPTDLTTKKDVFERNSTLFEKIETIYNKDRFLNNQWWYWEKDVNENVENEFLLFLDLTLPK